MESTSAGAHRSPSCVIGEPLREKSKDPANGQWQGVCQQGLDQLLPSKGDSSGADRPTHTTAEWCGRTEEPLTERDGYVYVDRRWAPQALLGRNCQNSRLPAEPATKSQHQQNSVRTLEWSET